MQIFEKVLNKVLLDESVSIADVNDALDNHKRVIINYHTKGEDKNTWRKSCGNIRLWTYQGRKPLCERISTIRRHNIKSTILEVF